MESTAGEWRRRVGPRQRRKVGTAPSRVRRPRQHRRAPPQQRRTRDPRQLSGTSRDPISASPSRARSRASSRPASCRRRSTKPTSPSHPTAGSCASHASTRNRPAAGCSSRAWSAIDGSPRSRCRLARTAPTSRARIPWTAAGCSSRRIARCRRAGRASGTWTSGRSSGCRAGGGSPRNLGPAINGQSSEYMPSVDREGNLYFERHGLNVARWRNGDDVPAEKYRPGDHQPAQPGPPVLVAPDGSYLLFDARRPGSGKSLLFISYRLKDGGWSQGIRVFDQRRCARVPELPDGVAGREVSLLRPGPRHLLGERGVHREAAASRVKPWAADCATTPRCCFAVECTATRAVGAAVAPDGRAKERT